MGNLRERFGVFTERLGLRMQLGLQYTLAFLMNIVPAIVLARKWLTPIFAFVWLWISKNWKFLVVCGGLYATVKYARIPETLPTLPNLPAVPMSAVLLVFGLTLLMLSLSAFGYVVFTFLALVIKVNQAISADVRGVNAFVSKLQGATDKAAEGNFYSYNEEIQAGIEEQQRAKREKRISTEEFDNFVKQHAGDLDADMGASGLP